ncbi:MAG: cupin domain-containing protein, partial [Anaerolineae bacterium]|nr:cupin domain-containing protein [Anaerolineae bacterium]
MEPGDDHEIECGPDEELKLVFIKTPYLPDDKVDL